MGMDFKYAGSASYPRFDRELCEVAKVFGGIETEHLKERKVTENERALGYWFGFLSSDDSDIIKFVFPNGTNVTLVNWFNNIYNKFSVEETETVWKYIKEHPEIEEFSSQIWNELRCLTDIGDYWDIS